MTPQSIRAEIEEGEDDVDSIMETPGEWQGEEEEATVTSWLLQWSQTRSMAKDIVVVDRALPRRQFAIQDRPTELEQDIAMYQNQIDAVFASSNPGASQAPYQIFANPDAFETFVYGGETQMEVLKIEVLAKTQVTKAVKVLNKLRAQKASYLSINSPATMEFRLEDGEKGPLSPQVEKWANHSACKMGLQQEWLDASQNILQVYSMADADKDYTFRTLPTGQSFLDAGMGPLTRSGSAKEQGTLLDKPSQQGLDAVHLTTPF